MADGPTDTPTKDPNITIGDIAATEGRWRDAIDSWQHALLNMPDLNPAVESRLTWFNQHRTSPERHRDVVGLRLIVCSVITAVLAAVLLLLPDDPGSGVSDMVATGAWVLIAASAATAVIASRRIGQDRQVTTGELSRYFEVARAHANRLHLNDQKERVNP